jgi:KRAB domain-containing zinc finger protein
MDIHIFNGICEKERVSNMKKKNKRKGGMCNICGQKYRDRSKLKKHILWKHETLEFSCDQCKFRAPSEKYVVEHKAYKHEGKGPRCDQCDFVAMSKKRLNTHLLNVHGEGLKLLNVSVGCPHPGCNKTYANNIGLKRHIMLHTGERPYKCDSCEKSFIQKGTLKEHIRVHTGEKPFKCLHCDKAFTQSVGLKSHMNNHIEVEHGNSLY